jgi:competence protein ComEA
MNRSATLAIGFAAAIAFMTMSAAMQDRFQDGHGKTELLRVCSGCHDPETVLANPQTAPEWSETLATMARQGAEATDEEWRLVEQYLDVNLAIIRINAAAADEIHRTVDVTDTVADAVVKYRDQNGPFKSVDDLKKVPGLDAAKVDARKDRLIF